MVKTSTELFDLYTQIATLTADVANPTLLKSFQQVQEVFEDKQEDFNIKVMMYGVYNAGKSTLINALLGQNIAATGDVPLTDRIHQYQWKNYTIYDTPGIDAPKAHEIVTETQLRRVDGIIFVVNPQGAVEERKTLEVLVDLLADRRKVFLVLNEKNRLTEEDFTKLKNAIRERIQEIAEKKGLTNILKDIPILRVNAALAVKGRIENPGYLNRSGYNELAEELSSFLAGISDQDILQRLVKVLKDYIAEFESFLDNSENESIYQNYNQLLQNISTEYRATKDRLQNQISQEGEAIKQQSKTLMMRDPKNSESAINAILASGLQHIIQNMEQEAQYLELQFQGEIQELQQMIIDSERLNIDLGSIDIDNPQSQELSEIASTDANREKAGGILTTENINHSVQIVGKFTKPEHIVKGLSLVKEWMPSLMKGVGPKTMEKWAGAVVGRWIPYVGATVTVLTSVWDLFSDDPEDKHMARMVEKQRAEEERYNQQIEDISQQVAFNFVRDCSAFISQNFDTWFNDLIAKLKETQGEVGAKKEANQDYLLALNSIKMALL